MSAVSTTPDCRQLRKFFQTGATRSLEFRKKQLIILKKALLAHEQEIYDALYKDLKESPEESYATELGLILSEINYTLRNLRQWMLPQVVGTDLVNLPSASSVTRVAKGVVLIIGPWNYPLQLLLIPLVGAIAGGNVAILKPSELSTHISELVEKIIAESFPSEYITVVNGDGAQVVPAMVKDFGFDHIFYTGSTMVGKSIYQLAAESLTPVSLELGGKSPCIIEADANLAVAARRTVLAKFVNAGQTCVAPDYLLVHESVKKKTVELLKKNIDEFYGANPAVSTDFGKIINERRFDRLIGYLSSGKIIHGGEYDKSKLYLSPTLMEEVSLDADLMKDEIFGPILPIFSFRSREEGEQIISRNPNPLSFYIFTSSGSKDQEWLSNNSFGGGCVNNCGWQFTNYHIPFGGIGNSGIGAYHGKYSFETFTHARAIMDTPTWFDPFIKYPPFKGRLKLFKQFFR